ncbi:MAG: hypothetical protein HKN47_24160 [Pirellulaceae bacterium]|nr:hypothetical protein [Pirellulaceae bacterium]
MSDKNRSIADSQASTTPLRFFDEVDDVDRSGGETGQRDDQDAESLYESDPSAYQQVILPEWEEPEFNGIGWWSVLTGLLGPATLLAVLSIVFRLAVFIVESYSVWKGDYTYMAIGWSLIVFPVAIMAAMIITVPMFWHVALTGRVLTTLVLAVPGLLGYWLTYYGGRGSIEDNVRTLGSYLVAAFVINATIGIIAEIWTPWSLIHSRHVPKKLPPTSLRTLLELTGAVAVLLPLILLFDFQDNLVLVWLCMAIAGLSALSLVLFCIGLLQPRSRGDGLHDGLRKSGHPSTIKRNDWALVAAVIPALLSSLVIVGWVVTSHYRWSDLTQNLVAAMFVVILDTALMLFACWLAVTWLRRCGWQCVHYRNNDLPSV